MLYVVFFFFFFFNDTATTEIYTLSLHDALPISRLQQHRRREDQGVEGEEDQQEAVHAAGKIPRQRRSAQVAPSLRRSEEHTSELQSLAYLVCRLLLEKKKNTNITSRTAHHLDDA